MERSRGVAARKGALLASVSPAAVAALLLAMAAPAQAANYTAANEAELQARIAQANADGDPSSTITLTATITLTDPAASLGASTKPLVIDNGGFALTAAAAGTVTYGGTITGTGSFGQTGPGTLILTGTNTYTAATTVAAGTLQLANGGQVIGVTTATIRADGAVLTITGTGTKWQQSQGVSVGFGAGGAATLNVQDGGQLVTSAVSVGTQTLPAGATSTVNVTGGGQIVSGGFNMGSFSDTGSLPTVLISGAGSIWTNSGNFAFNRGSFSVLDGGTFMTAAGTMGMNGTASLTVSGAGSAFTANGDFTLGSVLGTGSTSVLTLSDGGRFIANGALNIGTATNAVGVLNIGGVEGGPATGAGILQAASLTLGAGDRVNFNHTDPAYVFSTAITGAGAVNHTGPGTTILTGNSTYTGATTVTAGTLALAAGGQVSATSSTTVRGGGTLTITGPGSRWQTAGMTLGNSGGSAATLNVSDGAALAMTGVLLQSTGAGPNTSINVTGGGQVTSTGHTIGSTLSATGQGATILVSGTGSAWTNSGFLTFNQGAMSILDGGSYSAGAVTLARFANAALLVAGTGSTFTSGGTIRLGGFSGGTGILTVAEGGRAIAPGVILGAASGTTGVLNIGGAEGATATAPGVVATATVAFGPGGGRINFNHTDAAYVFAPAITGAGTVNQAGPGTTILTANHTYTGATTISAGTLQLGNGGTTGSIATDVTNNGVLAFNRSDTLTYAGIVSGSGVLHQMGPGTTVLTGANTYSGGTVISAGTLAIAADNAIGAATGPLTFNGGTLRFDAGFDLSAARPIAITAAGGTVDTNGFTTTVAQAMTGPGALTVTGGGTVILTGENSYTGGTTIAAGTLRIGAGGTSGSIIGDVRNDSPHTLVFDRSDTLVYGGVISGIGAVRQEGTGTTVLTGDSIYTGGTTIAAGTLQLGNGGTSGGIIGDVLNNGTLAFNRADTLTFSGVISGTGGVRQDGSGVTVLAGANTYSGPTAVNAGILRAGGVGVFSPNSAVAVAAGAALDLAGLDQTVAGLTNAGLVSLGGAPGTRLTVAGNYAGQGGILALNTVLGGDGSASDRLVVSGGAASGDTRLRIANVGGVGVQTVEGIQVVQVANGGTTAAGAFRLDTRVTAGAFEYQLFRGGNASADDWYLRSFLLATPASPETPATPSSPGIPLYRPEVALYAPVAAIGRQMGLATLGTLHSRLGGQDGVLTPADPDARSKLTLPVGNGAWARAFGERRRDRWDGPAEASAVGNLIGLQAGFDIFRTQPYAGGHGDVLGLYIAYADYNAPNVSGFAIGTQQRVGRLLMSGPSVGAYWTHVGPGGWYLDAVFQANWFDVKANSDFGTAMSTNGVGYTASLEAGYPIRFAPGWQVEPQAQVVWQSVSVDRARDLFSSVDWDEDDAVTGRLGARVQYTARTPEALWQPYAKLNLWHSFSGTDRVTFGSSAPIASRFGDTAVEIGGGITARVSDSTSFYAHADYRWSVDGGRGRHSATQGSIGIRFNW
ncbi:autotransporter outer membrane beta-barrel domain-containing protein [Plastoroseomonas hellenica]|uniref:autotransporter outer membrane beta-barrel domain-containing protein n=1 Tax=Plastoroseomonas hellenica TaxID=2687306 RepID=UPI001BA75E0E|nr:autotransporter outer membrane beta-barrel domain-containing protein [Plastoroseomonas hellenica]MBR0646627.1 autotransporter outer membrane beta-barrel domain-containing protein [Plastoroseomonas hellenica]